MNSRLSVILFLCITSLQLSAQDKSKAKYGNVTIDDLKQSVYSIDSNAAAIVIADTGSTQIVGNDKGNFSLLFKRFTRIHILNKNGYDAARVEIRVYNKDDQEEKLNSLKGVTYNIENGKVIETRLDKDNVYKDKINKNNSVKKFTLPNIKEGSIIEYQYEILSDFNFNLQPWEFQGGYPRLWSEYNADLPSFYQYITLAQGYQPFFIKSEKDHTDVYTVTSINATQASEHTSISTGVTKYKWVMKDVPALKEENFTSTINNHISRIEFQLSALAAPFDPKTVMASWPEAASDMLKDENFGESLGKDNPWLNDAMRHALGNAGNDLDKARNIFAWLRDNISCSSHNRLRTDNSSKIVLKTRVGSEAEINLLLTAMLKKANLGADPVILSTRSHGFVYAQYPLLDRFNYVITRLQVNDTDYYLDASQPGLGFGKLTNDLYNGHARVINEKATPLEFSADSLKDNKLTSVIIINDEKGSLAGAVNQYPGYYESYSMRKNIRRNGKAYFFDEVRKAFNSDFEFERTAIDSLDKYDYPIAINYDFKIHPEKNDLIYINPMFAEAMKENPLKSPERTYPVEMPHPIDEIYLLKLDIPVGYTIEELPKEIIVKLNEDDDGFFEYRISESNGFISLRSHILLKRTFYSPNEYHTLREFFNMVVKKQSEQIVFKKKK